MRCPADECGWSFKLDSRSSQSADFSLKQHLNSIVEQEEESHPDAATWKKIDGMSAVLPPADAERVDAEGEQISIAEYETRRRNGTA